jgi:polyketide synthase 13
MTNKKTRHEIEAFITTWIARERKVEVKEIDPTEAFTNLGLTSRQAVALSGALEKYIGQILSPSLVWDYPTIEQVAAHLEKGD